MQENKQEKIQQDKLQHQYQTIEYDISEQGIAQIRLNQPNKHNAFDEYLISELTALLQLLEDNEKTRLIILSANGKSFSAGADLNWMRRMSDYSRQENYQDSLKLAALMNTLYSMSCPTIAAIQGAAYGGGVGLVACCDIAISVDSAKFCLSEVKLGLIPAVISPYVVKAIGERNAKRYFVTAEVFSADKAHQLGLVSEIVTNDNLQLTINKISEQIINNGPEAVKYAKKLISDVSGRDINQPLCSMTAQRIADVRSSIQGKEGISAFLDKRAPDWQTSLKNITKRKDEE